MGSGHRSSRYGMQLRFRPADYPLVKLPAEAMKQNIYVVVHSTVGGRWSVPHLQSIGSHAEAASRMPSPLATLPE